MIDVLSSLLHGTCAGIVYSMLVYMRNRSQAGLTLRSGEKLSDEAIEQIIELVTFNPAQFITTVIQGAIIGLVAWLLSFVGIPLMLEGAENILLQMGLLALTRKIYGLVSSSLAK